MKTYQFSETGFELHVSETPFFCLCFIPHLSSQFLLENLTSRYGLHPCSASSLGGTRPLPGVSLYFVSIRVLVPVTQPYTGPTYVNFNV